MKGEAILGCGDAIEFLNHKWLRRYANEISPDCIDWYPYSWDRWIEFLITDQVAYLELWNSEEELY